MSKAWGGDTIETVDGRIGVVISTMFNIGPERRETEYAFRFPGEWKNPRFETGPDGKYASGDRSHRAYESEIARIVAYGRHDYATPKPPLPRGRCSHCGVSKKDHEARP